MSAGVPPNQPGFLPRLAGKGNKAGVLSRSAHLAGSIPTYYGPDQDSLTDPLEVGGLFQITKEEATPHYRPPGRWHKQGTLLRVPRSVRFYWEEVFVETFVYIAVGFTGHYQYGVHINSNNVDATAPPGVFPLHNHATFPAFLGLPEYAIKVTLTGEGHSGGYDTSIKNEDWYNGDYLPPIILEEYEDRTSATYAAVKILWDIASSYHGQPDSDLDITPPIHFHSDGPTTEGICYPKMSGAWAINGEMGGSFKDPHTIGLDIPAGWDQPPPPRPPSQLRELSDGLMQAYKVSTNPYLDVFPYLFPHTIDDFLSKVAPDKDGYFAPHSLTFILLAKPRPVPGADDERVERIRKFFPDAATYGVVIFLEMDNMGALSAAGDGEADAFVDAMMQFCALVGCNWHCEQVRAGDGRSIREKMEAYIKRYLRPELGDAPPPDPSAM